MSSVAISRSSTWKSVTVALATSTTISDSFDARPGAIYGLIIPSTFDGSSIGFQVSHDNTTFVDLYDNTGTIVALACTASRAYDLPTALAPWQYWKIKCATAQTATDTVFLVVAKG